MNAVRLTIKIVWRFLRPRWAYVLLNLAANLISALFEGSTVGILAVALQVLSRGQAGLAQLPGPIGGWLDQSVLVHGRETVFLGLVLAAILAQMMRSAFQFLADFIAVYLQTRAQAEAYQAVYAKILRLPFARSSSFKLGELTHALALTDSLQHLSRVGELVRTAMMIASYVALLLWISWPMTLAAAAGYWLISGLFLRILKRVVAHAESLLHLGRDLNQKATEFLQGLRLLHSFARQEDSIRTIHGLAEAEVRHRRRAILWSNAVEPITDIFTVFGAGIFLIIGTMALGGPNGAGLPKLLAFLLGLYRLTPRLHALNAALSVLAGRVPGLQRMDEFLNLEDAPPRASAQGAVLAGFQREIEFKNVTLRYLPDEPAAVADLSFRIPRGSFVALVGASGAGKSTVVDLLLRLFEPTSGAIQVDGMDLKEIDPAEWRRRVGVVNQEPFLFHASIRENIAFGKPDATPEEIGAAARAAHAHEFIQQLAQDYDTVIGDRGYRLSGGQRQRIALARALIGWPSILILDEATSALDSESERFIQQALEEQRGRCTLLTVAHRISTVAQADRIVVLSGGRIVEEGSHAQLLAREGIYARLRRLQSSQEQAQVPVELEAKSP